MYTVYSTPPSAAQKPLSAYTPTMVGTTGSPISTADCSLPPMAYTVRPNWVERATSVATATTTRAARAPADSDAWPSGTRTPASHAWKPLFMPIDSVLMSMATPRARNMPASVTTNGARR